MTTRNAANALGRNAQARLLELLAVDEMFGFPQRAAREGLRFERARLLERRTRGCYLPEVVQNSRAECDAAEALLHGIRALGAGDGRLC